MAKANLVVTRVFHAPVEQVWKAWCDPAYVMQWWGPQGFTCPIAQMNFCEGGTTLVCMRAPRELGGRDMYNTWTYTEIAPLQRIQYILNFTDKDGRKIDPVTIGLSADLRQEVRHLVAFRATSSNETELTVTEYDWTVGQMMEMSRLGLEQCLDKMAAILADPQ